MALNTSKHEFRVRPGCSVTLPARAGARAHSRVPAGTILEKSLFTDKWLEDALRHGTIEIVGGNPPIPIGDSVTMEQPGRQPMPPLSGKDRPNPDGGRPLGPAPVITSDKPPTQQTGSNGVTVSNAGSGAAPTSVPEPGETAPAESQTGGSPDGTAPGGTAKTAPSPWTLDPRTLQNKKLDDLNVMVAERDSNSQPFTTRAEAIAQLSMHFGKTV